MAAIRFPKDRAVPSVPFLWNAALPTRATPHQGSHVDSADDVELQKRYELGFHAGEVAGKAAQADAAIEELTATIANLTRTRASLFQSAQGDVLRLAIAVARRILHREILMAPDVLGGVISVALERIEESDLHTVRVHPLFVDRIREHLSGRINGRKLEVVGDPSLPPGGCVFETQHGTVDAGLESQLSEIERGLADHLEIVR